MPFVLDSSVTAVWALGNEDSTIAEAAALRLKQEAAVVPSVWWYEIRNLLVVNERRRRLTASDSALFLSLISAYPIRIEPAEDEQTIFQFARQYGLSFYDAAYLAVAHRHRAPLATLDKALQAAALAAGIVLIS
jgi:predicted nucleic acid-binding protein